MMRIPSKKNTLSKSLDPIAFLNLFGVCGLQRGVHSAQMRRGQALLISVLFLMLTSSAVVSVITLPLIKNVRIVEEGRNSRESFALAEGLVEDVVYRYKSGQDIDSTESLAEGGNTVSALITNTPSGRTVTAIGNAGNAVRTVETDLIAGIGASFSYGVQTGTGGFILHNNAVVNGNVYANGNITGSNGAAVTGSAFAANSAALASDQSNTAPSTPPNTITFGNANASQDVAQSFELSQTGRINKVQFYVRKTGSPSNATVRIATNSGSNPSGTTLTSGTLLASQVTTSLGWVEVVFPSNPELTASTTYWVVIDNASSNASNYYALGANTAYTNGTAKVGRFGTSWSDTTPAGLDGYFSVFLGGLTATIDDVDVGTGGVGNAHAHAVTNSTIAGSLYCATGSGNNKPCDTSLADPAPQGFPISQANIDAWKTEAEEGGATTSVSVISTTKTLGPIKINGNLVVQNNAQLTLTGTIWVTGTILIDNNAVVRLSSSYGENSGVLLSDGRVTVQNNGSFQGSGTSGSYLMLLTTSDCPISSSCGGARAVTLANNVGTVIINAQNGTIYFSNNAGAKQATAHTIELENNANITYETGLIDLNFVSGPGGAFDITGWQEVE